MNDKNKGCFVVSNCGCEAIHWCESDGSEWIDFRMCKLHESAEALQAENERLRASLMDVIMWLENAPFDYSNGNVCNGIDEGNVQGWNGHGEVIDAAKAALGYWVNHEE